MEVGERSFSREDGRSPRQSGNMVPDIEGGIYDIFLVYGTEERDGRLFWPSLNATSKAAILHPLDSDSNGMRRKELPIAETSTKQLHNRTHLQKQSTWPTSFSSKCKSSSKGRL